MKHLINILGFIACMTLGLLTGIGEVQKVIHFAGVANEIAFCFLCFMMASCFMFASILPEKKVKKIPQKNF